jgi:hypothetical protein
LTLHGEYSTEGGRRIRADHPAVVANPIFFVAEQVTKDEV